MVCFRFVTRHPKSMTYSISYKPYANTWTPLCVRNLLPTSIAFGLCIHNNIQTRRAGSIKCHRDLFLLTQYRQHIVTHDFIDAAHHLPHVPAGHPCARLHGHRFLISIAFDGMNIPRGWPAFWQTLRRQFHNTCLNQQAGLDNPTSEKFSEHLFLLIRKQYASLSWVCIQETQTSNSVFDGERFHIWKNQRFESAIIQSHHSHTGRSVDVRLHLSGLLEKDRGWVRDFTEIKSIFKPLYDQVLDHHALDRQQAQPSSLSRWLLAQLSSDIPELAAVELYDGIKGACAWRKVKHHHVLHH